MIRSAAAEAEAIRRSAGECGNLRRTTVLEEAIPGYRQNCGAEDERRIRTNEKGGRLPDLPSEIQLPKK